MTEFWDLYDGEGHFLGEKIKRGDPIPVGTFHRVIHIWIQNERGEFLIQRRALHLSWFPNRWSTTTGSVISGSYDFLLEAYRELEEELQLSPVSIDISFERELIISNSLVSIYKGFLPSYKINAIVLNDEVSDVRWMTKSKIQTLVKSEEFVPYSEELFTLVFKMKIE